MPAPAGQSPTPSNGNQEGTDIQSAAASIEGLLSEGGDGSLNIGNGQLSRAHPDYDHDKPHDQQSGRDLKGRFKSKTAKSEQDHGIPADDSGEADHSANDDQIADGDVEDDDTDTGDTDDQLANSADQQADSDPSETDDSIQTVAQLAEALEVPIEELQANLTTTFNAAGEEVTVTLTELQSGYQKDADYRRQTGKLADDRRTAEVDYSQRMEAYDGQNRFLANHLNAAEQHFTAQLEDSGLATLRVSDPAEWTARREEIGINLNQIRQARDQATQQYGAFQAQQLLDLKGRELASLKGAIPDFKAEVHGEQARNIMSTLGYTPQETSKIFDHRLVMAAIELGGLRTEVETLRAEKAKAVNTVKRVTKQVPKLQKPGKQTAASGKRITRSNVAQLKAKAKKSGNLQDAAAVIENFI